MVRIDPNNDSNYNFKHQSMTVDFDPFWTFKMFGDPLLLIGDPQNLSLVTPFGDPRWGSPRVTKKKTMCLVGLESWIASCHLLLHFPAHIEGTKIFACSDWAS